MSRRDISSFGFSVRKLDMELIARGAQTPLGTLFDFNDKEGSPQRDETFRAIKVLYLPPHVPALNPALKHFTLPELLLKLRQMIQERKLDGDRGVWGTHDRLDIFDVTDERVRRNAHSAAAVFMYNDLQDMGDGYRQLRVKNYGELYNLCRCEPFYEQPVAAGAMCTGVLVAADVVATAAHFVNESNVRALGFIFGYQMADPVSPVIRFHHEKIYRGIKILHRKDDTRGINATGSDWVLVQLDRPVEGQEIAALSRRPAFPGQNLYVLGYPCGLPLKYAPGPVVRNTEQVYFMSRMDIYSGNSGSPVFCAETHEMVGMVVQSDPRDFRWIGDGWVSVIYPNDEMESPGDRCIKVTEFLEYA